EATTNCWAVADALRPHVARVVVSNPMATKAIAQAKVKTDKVDAYVLAQLLRCDFLPEVWQPDEATRRLRELTGRRAALVRQRTRMRNRIHSVLAMRLVEAPSRLFHGEGLAWLEAVELDEQARMLVDSDLRQLEFLQKEIDLLDAELARRGYASQPVKLLMTLPGVDVTTAEAMLAAWGDPTRFPDGDHAASYLGLVPSTKQSANQCYHGPITKRGNSQARWMLIEAAQHLDKHPGPLGHFFRRLAKKKNRNVAVVAAARKLAVIAWQMLVTGEPYRYAIPRTTETKLARLRVKATGERRKSGSPKGTKCTAKLPGGSRTIRSLEQVCQAEGLPTPRALSPGEKRTVHEAGCEALVATIAAAQVVPRRRPHRAEGAPAAVKRVRATPAAKPREAKTRGV
ncbi:MAG: IS110 family transposase, partial [Paracoccaceae bacterium]